MASGRKFTELMQLTAAVVPTKEATTSSGKPKTAPGQMMNLVTQRDEAFERVEKAEVAIRELEEQLRVAKQQGGALELALDELHEVDGRRRILAPDEYEDLKNNLAYNPLASPITVRVRAEGGYEIVSGHNRVQIYRELKREKIKAWLADASDEEAEDLAFFANALAAKLPDYDKYRGYKRIMAKHANLSNKDLCVRVGISERQLNRLLAFDGLPEGAHDILSARPSLIGATTAEKLSGLAGQKRAPEVIEALSKLFRGEFAEEREVLKHAASTGTAVAAPPPEEQTFKLGKSKYATVRRVKKTVRIDCASEEEAAAINTAIAALIEQRIKALKSGH
jgi:ParB family chromosome partitioning protein